MTKSSRRRPDKISLFYRRFGIGLLVLGCLFITFYGPFQFGAKPATKEHPPLPTGIEWIKHDGGAAPKDFFAMRELTRQVWAKENQRPYSIAGQVQFMRHWFPFLKVSMPVAYAPFFFIVYYPFTLLPPIAAYTAYNLIELGVLLCLFLYYFFPRLITIVQTRFFFLTFYSISFLVCFRVGQNPVFTTALLVLGWMTLYNRSKKQIRPRSWKRDLLLALFLLVLSAKPNHAVVLGSLYLAAGAWIPLLLAAGLLALVCAFLSPLIGGWPTWLQDYAHLTSFYYPGGLGPSIYFGPDQSTNLVSFLVQLTPIAPITASLLSKILWPSLTVVFLVLHWRGKIDLHEFFTLNFANFILFCPSFSNSDDWTIALLIVESAFFTKKEFAWLKTILLIGAVDFCQVHPTFWERWPIPFPCKLILITWLAMEWILARNSQRKEGPRKQLRQAEIAL